MSNEVRRIEYISAKALAISGKIDADVEAKMHDIREDIEPKVQELLELSGTGVGPLTKSGLNLFSVLTLPF